MRSFELRLPEADPPVCRVRIGVGARERLLADLGDEFAGRTAVVISDSNVAPLHGEPLRERLSAAGFDATLLSFPAGEASKSRETKADLEDALAARGTGRRAIVVSVGGGVTCDLAGFVAATWHRGVPVVHAPTSLLAMVDAALGGKTAVDLPGGKNLVGAMHHPFGVYADVSTLESLPQEELVCGFSEVVKAATLADRALFDWLEENVDALLARDSPALERTVESSLAIKARIVEQDPDERGPRTALNLGHTVAHALEGASGFRIRHGHAVSVGLVVESRIAVGATGFPEDEVRRLASLLRSFGLPTDIPPGIDPDAILAAARRDKKSRLQDLRCALPERIGRMHPGDDGTVAVDASALRAAIERSRAATS